MEESYQKINVSEIYKTLKDIEFANRIDVFDDKDMSDDINSSNDFILENLEKLNSELKILRAEIKKNNGQLMKASLIQLRINVMNVASEFDNLRGSMDDLLKALCTD